MVQSCEEAQNEITEKSVSEKPRVSLRHKLALIALGLLIGLILCESVLRIQEPFFHIMARRFSLPTAIDHLVWDHQPPPNMSVTLAADDLEPYEFFTNSLGVRHPREVLVPKPSHLTRVLVLGDSFTEGYRYEDTVAPRLEKRLNETFAGRQFEVINCGATTYSPILYYLRLKHQLLALQPDFIILNIDQTDPFDDYWRYRPHYKVDTDGNPHSIGSNPPAGWGRDVKDWMKEHSYVVRLASGVRSRMIIEPEQRTRLEARGRPLPIPENVFAYHTTMAIDSEEWRTQIGFCLNNISRVMELCKQQNIPLTITVYPHRQQIKADDGFALWHREFERRVEQLCRAREVDFYSAYDGLAQAFNEGQPLYREKDIHFTNQGQRVWGDLISDHFSNALLKDSGHLSQNQNSLVK